MPRCPKPHKHRHKSYGEAWGQVISLRNARKGDFVKGVRPYHCPCGYWHIGHAQGRTRKRDRRAA